MGKLIVSQFMTIDGVMQAPGEPDEDPRGGFEHGAWIQPYTDEALGEVIAAELQQAEALLFGRRTYETFAGHWPAQPPEDPFAGTFNEKAKYVASRTLMEPLEWRNSSLLGPDLAAEVKGLKEASSGTVLVLGGGVLFESLVREDLIDELHLMVPPLALGTGRRLFGTLPTPLKLELTDCNVTTAGVVVLRYRTLNG